MSDPETFNWKRDYIAFCNAFQASVFLDAADKLIGPEESQGIHEYSDPPNFLIAHAVEIALIAFIRINGAKGQQKDHDLKGLLAAAKSCGLETSSEFEEYIDVTATPHGSHQFRYTKIPRYGYIRARSAVRITRPLIDVIRENAETIFSDRWPRGPAS